MSMQERSVSAHRKRIADLVGALSSAGFRHRSIIDVQGLLSALDGKEQKYSAELSQKAADTELL